jgi:hypothetical protein
LEQVINSVKIIKNPPVTTEVLASTESSPELIKKRRKEMRDKSNNISTLAKNLNIEGSSMEPIKEEKSVLANLDNSKSE